jgi:hypothetical protein
VSQSVLFSHYGYYRVLNLARQLALIHFRFDLTMENLPDDETMEILTDDQMKESKPALALIQPETTEDKELQGTGENKESLKSEHATTIENLPDDETMETLTDDQLREWKVALALNKPEITEDNQLQGTEDKKQQDTGENEETLNNKDTTTMRPNSTQNSC